MAQYDVDVFDCESNSTVDVNSAPMNEGVDIPEFDYSRKEVEVCLECLYIHLCSYSYTMEQVDIQWNPSIAAILAMGNNILAVI